MKLQLCQPGIDGAGEQVGGKWSAKIRMSAKEAASIVDGLQVGKVQLRIKENGSLSCKLKFKTKGHPHSRIATGSPISHLDEQTHGDDKESDVSIQKQNIVVRNIQRSQSLQQQHEKTKQDEDDTTIKNNNTQNDEITMKKIVNSQKSLSRDDIRPYAGSPDSFYSMSFKFDQLNNKTTENICAQDKIDYKNCDEEKNQQNYTKEELNNIKQNIYDEKNQKDQRRREIQNSRGDFQQKFDANVGYKKVDSDQKQIENRRKLNSNNSKNCIVDKTFDKGEKRDVENIEFKNFVQKLVRKNSHDIEQRKNFKIKELECQRRSQSAPLYIEKQIKKLAQNQDCGPVIAPDVDCVWKKPTIVLTPW